MNTVTRVTALTAFRDAAPAADGDDAASEHRAQRLGEEATGLKLSIYSELDTIEAEWRRFEEFADCTAFQTFAWVTTWHRHVGLRVGARPAIVVGRYGDGKTAFVLPLCVTS